MKKEEPKIIIPLSEYNYLKEKAKISLDNGNSIWFLQNATTYYFRNKDEFFEEILKIKKKIDDMHFDACTKLAKNEIILEEIKKENKSPKFKWFKAIFR